jgi:hypothetical protein
MKISINDIEIFTLTEIQKTVIKNDINEDELNQDMARRLEYILINKYDNCFSRLKLEWDQKLIDNGIESIPTNKDAYAQLVFSQPNYLDRKARDLASAALLNQG